MLHPPHRSALILVALLFACAPHARESGGSAANRDLETPPEHPAPIAGEAVAVAYSGYRAGQRPDRGEPEIPPSRAEVREDLSLIADAGVGLIRVYDSGEHTRTTLEVIREDELPIRVLLGVWLRAERSNHAGCPWLTEPIPEEILAANRVANGAEVARAIALAAEFDEVVCAVSVGNEALVEWTDHLVGLDAVVGYVREVRDAIQQPVTVAENYEWWARSGARLAAEVDLVGVHTYPVWEGRAVDGAIAYMDENVARVRAALPGRRLAVLEAGWASVADEFGVRATEAAQARHVRELADWARRNRTTVFVFEAFDEPWKGDPARPGGAEKHWGLWDVERAPKPAAAALAEVLERE